MRTIHIFLSSSESDTHGIRMELGNFVRALNDRLRGRLYIRLRMNGEDGEPADRTEGSEYVYLLFFKNAEDGTLADFHAAYERFRAGGSPKIMTFFRTVPEGESAGEVVLSFMKELSERLEHYYTRFDSTDTVFVKLLMELAGDLELFGEDQIAFRDARLYIGGEEFELVRLDNLPFYGKHKAIRELRRELDRLEDEIDDARRASRENTDDNTFYDRSTALSNERTQVRKKLNEYEKELLKVGMRLTKRASDGKPVTRRTRQAMELFDEGRVSVALSVLDPSEFALDLKLLDGMEGTLAEQYEALVRELTTKIDIIESRGVTSQAAEEIRSLYEVARDIVLKHNLDLDPVIDYVGFLWQEKDYTRGIDVGEKLYHRFKSMDSVKDSQWGGSAITSLNCTEIRTT